MIEEVFAVLGKIAVAVMAMILVVALSDKEKKEEIIICFALYVLITVGIFIHIFT